MYLTGMIRAGERRPKHGVLTSPHWPQRYDNNHDSTQTIQVAEGNTISWAWKQFYVEPVYDYVQIVDGDGTDLTPKIWGSGFDSMWRSRFGSTYTSNSNIIHVKFHTDKSGQENGWRLKWNEIVDDDSKNDESCLTNQKENERWDNFDE